MGVRYKGCLLAGVCLATGLLFSSSATRAATVQSAKLIAFDDAALDQFGMAVAIDGDTAVIGSLFDDDLGDASGSAYVFQRNGSLWSFQAKLTAADGSPLERFGSSVSISGNTIVVGSPFAANPGPGTFSGAAYVFDRSGTTWSQTAKLIASDPPQANENAETFGTSSASAAIKSWWATRGMPMEARRQVPLTSSRKTV